MKEGCELQDCHQTMLLGCWHCVYMYILSRELYMLIELNVPEFSLTHKRNNMAF